MLQHIAGEVLVVGALLAIGFICARAALATTEGALGETEGRKGADLLGALLANGDTLRGQPRERARGRSAGTKKKPLQRMGS